MARLKSHPALVVIDMQNGFCNPQASFGRLGIPTTRQAAIIPTIKQLIRVCRAHGIPVFYTQAGFNEDYSDAGIAEEELPGLKDAKGFVRGSWDAEIVEELKAEPSDTIIHKTKNNAFFGSSLDQRLREKNINQIIATGVATNVCVESTVRDARSYGFHAVTVSDGTATLSEEQQAASMLNLQRFGGTITAKELEDELQG